MPLRVALLGSGWIMDFHARGVQEHPGAEITGAANWRRESLADVEEAIKLVEGGLAELCDEVWLVVCDADVQLTRLAARGASADDAAQRVAAQAGLAERLASAATRTIDTSADRQATRDQVEAALADALRHTD